ncbi:hypothetical protein [Cognatishimia activa]|uniref:Uncharacterized protein n=1 Tax=Cognatishimia activa TaxID=1715691 RepID=A0A0P1ISG4_9RHOB|nr:hypothetical protein [Cognatishimia activa]CUI67566.1 hypothetical protein TA5113_01118 [Cognatishimia activa]CUK26481.1 hypothetical protein TA5114_02291 [Cognatishimia activa]
MRHLIGGALLAMMILPFDVSPADAGPISSACRKSDREAATRRMCNCLQSVANGELSRSDQKLAASFFKDPHKAQEIRQSDRRSHEKFWLRYKDYGQTAAALCSQHS